MSDANPGARLDARRLAELIEERIESARKAGKTFSQKHIAWMREWPAAMAAGDPHPWYGPCDGMGPCGSCSECVGDVGKEFHMDQRTFYGPHACAVCGALICKVSYAEGGDEFDYPEGPIYPNTAWTPHVHRTDRGPQRMGESEGAVPSDAPHVG